MSKIDEKLIGNTDPRVWAEEFVKLVHEHPQIATDEGTMLGWFANAMMAGHDEGRAIERRIGLLERVRELVFQVAGAATMPLLQDHPDYVFPSERVADAVERVCSEFGLPVKVEAF